MIKLDTNFNVTTTSNAISTQKKSFDLSKRNSSAPQSVPITSIQNINITPLTTVSNYVPASTTLSHQIHRIINYSSYATCDEKLKLYKTYLHYGCTPQSSNIILGEWKAMLLHDEIKKTPYSVRLHSLLPLLEILNESLLSPKIRLTLSSRQLAEVNLREDIIRALITAATLLPAILLSTNRTKHAKDTLCFRHTFINELIQAAQRRITSPSPAVETKLRALLHAPPPLLREKLERFIADSQAQLTKPVYNELRKHIQIIEHAAADAQRFLTKLPIESNPSPPLPTDILHAIRRTSQCLQTLTKQLRLCILPDDEKKKSKPIYHTWLSQHGIEPAVPAAQLVRTLHRGLTHTSTTLHKLHKRINHEYLSPFQTTELKSFLSLSLHDRTQCLILKKMATPVQDSADKLLNVAANLRKAIHAAVQEKGYPTFLTASPEEALYIELAALTEQTPHTTLLLAAETAYTTAQHILNTDQSPPVLPPFCTKFSTIVQEYANDLRRGAHLLKNAVYHTQINFRQKTILSAIHDVEKIAGDIKHILPNALQSVSGISINSRFTWLRKLDIDLRIHWQGITTIAAKGHNNYILCSHSQHRMPSPNQIHCAVLPLLNEAEKLRGACRSIEVMLTTSCAQDTLDKTADNIKNYALDGIIQAEHTIQDTLSEKYTAIYLYYKHAACPPLSLRDILRTETQSLLSTARKLQETAWLLSWNAKDTAVQQSIVHIRDTLRSIKKKIKDAIETTTNVRLHINSPEGMIAKDAAEWLNELEKPPDGQSHHAMIAAITDRLCKEFTSPHDPDGSLFRLRITLAIRDVQQGTLVWPLTPQERLNSVRTPKDYTLTWAEKRLTYSMLYNCLIHYTPAALFSLSMVKNTLVSPLRLINLLLTPIRMVTTRRAMRKVRPGSSWPADLMAEYTTRELYQAVFRVVSLLSPQLFKTMAATGITSYGLIQGGQYRQAFLNRALARLPADLFWVGGFAAWHQTLNVFHALHQQETLSPAQIKRLQEMLNLSPTFEENTQSTPQINSRVGRSLRENVEPTQGRVFKQPTTHLIEESKQWKDSSAYDWLSWKHLDWVRLKNINPVEGEIHTIENKKFIYLRGLFWEITLTDEDHFSINATNANNDAIICQVTRINNTWDLVNRHNEANSEFIRESSDEEGISLIKIEKRGEISKVTSPNNESIATNRLIKVSKQWKDSCAVTSLELNNHSPVEGFIYTVSDQQYLYIRGLFWKISFQYEDRIFIQTENHEDKVITNQLVLINGEWNFMASEITSEKNKFSSDLLDASKKWKNSFTEQRAKSELENISPEEGVIYTVSDEKYLYMRGLFWEVIILSYTPNTIAIRLDDDGNDLIIHHIEYINNVWDFSRFKPVHKKFNSQLLAESTQWKNSSAVIPPELQNIFPIESFSYTVSGQKYFYMLGSYWKIAFSYQNHIFIEAENSQNKIIINKLVWVNNQWYLVPSKIEKKNQLLFIKGYYHQYQLKEHITAGKSSLQWWLDIEWRNTGINLLLGSIDGLEKDIITTDDQHYIYVNSHYWRYDYKNNMTLKGTLKNKNNDTVDIINIRGEWYLANWQEQRKYLYSIINGLNALSEQNKIIIDEILQNTLENNPEMALEEIFKITDTALSVFLFQNIEDKQYVNQILEIKYLLMLIMPDTINQLLTIQQMEIMQRMELPFNLEILEEDLYQLYPTEINTKNYNSALKNFYFPPKTATIDKNDVYYKGIAYCNSLISNWVHKNNLIAFNDVLFFLTKKELMLSSTNTVAEEEREELSWLNIAKYHLYILAKYLPLYRCITDQNVKDIPPGTDKNTLAVLKKAKINAVRIYYLNHEKLNEKDTNISDDQSLNEYSHIVRLNNQASEYLETVTAALFYYAYHPEEEFNVFNFIKAKLYYQEQMEWFIKEIYTFDTTPPPNFITHRDFHPSKDFSSRSDYTQQFNDYIDKGSSEYESKLLTPLLLSQLNITLEDLSSPPKRWFTLKLTSYDYTPRKDNRDIYYDATEWPEKLNVIELNSGDYITISEINGNMKTNFFKKNEYSPWKKIR